VTPYIVQWVPFSLVFAVDQISSYATGNGYTIFQQHDQHSKHWQAYSV